MSGVAPAGAGAGTATAAAGDGGVRFDDLHRVMALFAQAIAGRTLRLVPDGPPVTRAHLPPRRAAPGVVPVPAATGGFGSPRHDAGAHRIAVLRELARLDDAAAGPVPTGTRPRLFVRVLGTLERLRVDASIRRRFPGARADLDRVHRRTLAQRAGVAPAGRVRRLLDGWVRDSLGDERALLVARDPSGMLAPMLAAADAVRGPQATPHDAARAALAICRLLEAVAGGSGHRGRPGARLRVTGAAPGPAGPSAAGKHGAGGDAADGPPDDAADPRPAVPGEPPSAPLRRTELRDARGGRQAGGRPAAQGGADAHARLARPDAPADTPPATPPAAPRLPGPGGPRSALHDEWDCIGRRYLRAWCRVNEHRLRGDAPDFLADVRQRHPALARRIRGRLVAMRPQARRRVPGVVDGDEIDLDRLVEGLLDRRAGRGTEPRPYQRRDPQVRAVAAAFLVDMSASTALALPDPRADGAGPADPPAMPDRSDDDGALLYGLYDDPPDVAPRPARRRVIDVAKDALALMSDALAALGDAHAIYGFSGQGRHDVEFHVAKDFDEPVSPATWAAIAAIEPRGSTRMGAAIRHAAARLARQGARRRLLIVVSDGYPQDIDYGPDRNDESYGIRDTARALQEATRAGLATYCVTIDPGGHDYLRAMCAAHRYAVIDDVQALPEALAKVYLGLTRDD